jgi:multiple sugar transport system substrate-binding protein
VLLGGLVAVLAGCGGDGGGGGTELRWFISIQPGGSVEKVAADCTKQSNGRYEIVPELMPSDATATHEQLIRRLGAEDPSVDLIGMDVIWTAEFANAGWLRPWEGPDARAVTRDVFESVIETASFEDKLYGAPFSTNTQLLWYRRDKIGKPPLTWEQMISEAERRGTTIQVQANRYEGYMAWVNALIEGAGGQILSGPEEVALQREPTMQALRIIGSLANSRAAPARMSTADEDVARLGFEAGESDFMVNYTFAYASALENAPKVAKGMGMAPFPRSVPGRPSAPPLGGFNIGVTQFTENPDLAFEAAKCLVQPKQNLTVTELDGLPPVHERLYTDPAIRKAYPGFTQLVKRSIEQAGPRPASPAYTDVSLAVQRALHPPDKIDPRNPESAYEELRSKVEDAAKRKGLL